VSIFKSTVTARYVAVWLGAWLWMAGCGQVLGKRQAAQGARAALFEAVELRNQDGDALAVAEMREKSLVLNFVFTHCPSVCPRQTRELAQVQKAIGAGARARIQFLSVSVDPANDTPEALKRFAVSQGADLRDWSFAVASAEHTERLTSRIGAFEPERRGEPAAHRTSIYVFDEQGRLVQRYAGAAVDAPRLARELEQLAGMHGGPRTAAR
jgi:protein SCO1